MHLNYIKLRGADIFNIKGAFEFYNSLCESTPHTHYYLYEYMHVNTYIQAQNFKR